MEILSMEKKVKEFIDRQNNYKKVKDVERMSKVFDKLPKLFGRNISS